MGDVTLEYSVKQDCFHISELDYICRQNAYALVNGCRPDYLIIGTFNSYDEADEEVRRLKKFGFVERVSNANRKSYSKRLAEVSKNDMGK